MSSKAVFIDRDGTINDEKNYVYRPDDFNLIPGVLEALKLLTQAKVDIYIITNQSGIARGFYTEKDFENLTRYMLELFQKNNILVTDVLYCPHHPEGSIPRYTIRCECRKPGVALLKRVLEKQNYSRQNMALIGDKNTDILTAKNFGIASYLVETGYGKEEKSETVADYIVSDLKAATLHLLKHWGQQ